MGQMHCYLILPRLPNTEDDVDREHGPDNMHTTEFRNAVDHAMSINRGVEVALPGCIYDSPGCDTLT